MPSLIAPHFGPTGSPDTYNASQPEYLGMVGTEAEMYNRTYFLAQLSPTGSAPAANQLLYWKDTNAFIVTTAKTDALNGGTTHGWRTEVAGILRNAASLGNFVWVLKRGKAVPVLSDGTGVAGDLIVAHTVSGQVTAVPAAGGTYVSGTALTTLGVVRTVPSAGTLTADFNAGNI